MNKVDAFIEKIKETKGDKNKMQQIAQWTYEGAINDLIMATAMIKIDPVEGLKLMQQSTTLLSMSNIIVGFVTTKETENE